MRDNSSFLLWLWYSCLFGMYFCPIYLLSFKFCILSLLPLQINQGRFRRLSYLTWFLRAIEPSPHTLFWLWNLIFSSILECCCLCHVKFFSFKLFFDDLTWAHQDLIKPRGWFFLLLFFKSSSIMSDSL